jgi:DNA-binding Lrp family transcriptional regulator
MNSNAQISNAQKTVLETIEQLVVKSGKTMISYSEIQKRSGFGRTAVINAVKLLDALGLIKISKPDCKYNENIPYSYQIIKE